MKNWILVPLLAVLSGCVSYYYPAEVTDDVYYRNEQPVRTDYSSSFASARYYPWWSVDYFYLGTSWGHSHNRFSIGFNYGYPYDSWYGWYDPFAWYYDPWGWSISYPLRLSYWHTPYYSRFYNRHAWNDYYWRDRYYRDHRSRHGDHDRWQRGERERDHRWAAGRDRQHDSSVLRPDRSRLRDQDPLAAPDRDPLRRRYEDGRIPVAGKGSYPGPGKPEPDGIRRQVSVAPADASGKRGMEVRSRGESKAKPTRTQPSRPVKQNVVKAPVVITRPVSRAPAYVSQPEGKSKAIVRSPAASKQKPIRVQPAPAREQHLSPVVRYEPPASSVSPSQGLARQRVAVPVAKPRAASGGYYRPSPAGQPSLPVSADRSVAKPVPRAGRERMAPVQSQRSQAPARPAARPAVPSRPQKSQARDDTGARPEPPARPAKRSRK